jgi:hypothetical protein
VVRRFLVVLAAVVVPLTACGGEAKAAPATVTDPPETTIDPTTPRQTAYFIAVAPYNDGVLQLNHDPQSTFDQKKAYCATVAPLGEQFARTLKGYTGWGDAQPEIDHLVVASGAAAKLQHECAEAATPGELDSVVSQLGPANAENDVAVAKVRQKLGLGAIGG